MYIPPGWANAVQTAVQCRKKDMDNLLKKMKRIDSSFVPILCNKLYLVEFKI